MLFTQWLRYPVIDPKSQRGGRGIALLFLDLGARRGWWSAPRPSCFTPGKDPVPIVQEVVTQWLGFQKTAGEGVDFGPGGEIRETTNRSV
jgi:hypothetical protein